MVSPFKNLLMGQFRQLHTEYTFDWLVCAYEDCEDSVCQLIPCTLCKNMKLFQCQAFCDFSNPANFQHALCTQYFREIKQTMKKIAGQRSWAVLGISKGQPVLCYHKCLATPFSVRKIGTQSTICRNYPAVRIAPPYIMCQHNLILMHLDLVFRDYPFVGRILFSVYIHLFVQTLIQGKKNNKTMVMSMSIRDLVIRDSINSQHLTTPLFVTLQLFVTKSLKKNTHLLTTTSSFYKIAPSIDLNNSVK